MQVGRATASPIVRSQAIPTVRAHSLQAQPLQVVDRTFHCWMLLPRYGECLRILTLLVLVVQLAFLQQRADIQQLVQAGAVGRAVEPLVETAGCQFGVFIFSCLGGIVLDW